VEGKLARCDARRAGVSASARCHMACLRRSSPLHAQPTKPKATPQGRLQGRKRARDLRFIVRIFGEQTACDALVQAERIVVAVIPRLGARASDMRDWWDVLVGFSLREVILAGGRLGALAAPFEHPRHAAPVGRGGVAAAAVGAASPHLVQRAVG
jgi:hypothetical protein